MDDASQGKSNAEDDTGKIVTVKTTDNITYSGVLVACSPQFDIGLEYAQKCPVNEKHNGCLVDPDCKEKMKFKSKDVVEIHGPIKEEIKKSNNTISAEKGFTTDAEISNSKNGGDVPMKERQLVAWTADDDGDFNGEWHEVTQISSCNNKSRNKYIGNRQKGSAMGWSAEDMLKMNEKLGVETSFNPDLSQYTTVKVEGDEHARRKADEIASQIESDANSRRHAQLENDDFERDLDQATDFDSNRNGNEFTSVQHRRNDSGNVYNRGQKYSANNRQPIIRRNDKPNACVQPYRPTPVSESSSNLPNESSAQSETRPENKFVFNPDAAPFVPKKENFAPTTMSSSASQMLPPAQFHMSNSNNGGMVTNSFPMQPMTQMYYPQTSTHSMPPPHTAYVPGVPMISGQPFMNPQQYYASNNHPMSGMPTTMMQTTMSHGYSAPNQTGPIVSIAASQPMMQMPFQINGLVANPMAMQPMAYYPIPPPQSAYMQGVPMMSSQAGFMNENSKYNSSVPQ